ncbi:MAG: penicillin-binding transpeptidase domain-containing protein [Clostridiales bacterium]|nr:penicillin-binding transpeptidase domain-containing protein [Clostridiales bacterium]
MLDDLIDKLKGLFASRLIPLSLIFIIMFGILINRVFEMQIVGNKDTGTVEEYLNVVERPIKSTRGEIKDRNGNVLAYNVSSYSVVMCDSAALTTNAEKNAMIDKLVKLLESYGYPLELNFGIELDPEGKLVFNVEDNALKRFLKEAYCKSNVNQLTTEQLNSTPQQVFDFLRYGDKENGKMFQISDEYTTEEALKIMMVRFTLFNTTPKYTQFTIASNVNDETVAAVKENLADLPGVEVKLETSRVYNDSKYFAHILGYTGLINSKELDTLNEGAEEGKEPYSATDVVGKIGIEKEMEEYLKGIKGIESVTVNENNKEVEVKVTQEPSVGNDVYLTIDRDLQIACYNILEKNIAEVLISKITPSMDYGTKGTQAKGILIPIYEVYNALINNNVIEIARFRTEDATSLEKSIYERFENKRDSIYSKLDTLLAADNKVTNHAAGSEMQEYLEFVYSSLTENKIVINSLVDKNDKTYLAYKDNKISLSEYLQYAITQNWVDLEQLGIGENYYSTDEIYNILVKKVKESLVDNDAFEKKIYRTMIFTKSLSGREICLLLFEQGVLEYNEKDISNLNSGRISGYDFMMQKLKNLEITPGQLALEPCSGSIVITDVKTGEVRALVTYPSYDNNFLANKIDWNYYQKLLNDNATPLLNRPTSQKTTTGSTFKPLSALIGLGENQIDVSTKIRDQVKYTNIEPSPSCWKPGGHGVLDVAGAIQHSCNYFFYEIGYRLMKGKDGSFNDANGIATIQKYASMFGLNDLSGVEIEEAKPEISNRDAVRTSIGYYHNFAPVQISRYISTIANRGTCFNYTLLDKVTDHSGKLVYNNEATILNEITQFTDSEWNAVQRGMYLVVNTGANSLDGLYRTLGVTVAGKTGTAQVSANHPNHALFVAYAPYENPEISMTCVIPNGYSSANSAKMGREVLGYYFNGENKEALLNGDVTAGSATNITISD